MKAPADPPSAAQPPVSVAVQPPITLGQFLKLAGLAATGGDAKYLVTAGQVTVNGRVERRRGHPLTLGDIVEVPEAHVAAVVNDDRSSFDDPARPSLGCARPGSAE